MTGQYFHLMLRAFGACFALSLLTLPSAAGEDVIAQRDGRKLRLSNDRVSIVFDEADGFWDAAWPGADAAVRRVRFSIEADKQTLTPRDAKAEAAPFKDAVGEGEEIRCRWGTGIEIEQCIRLYRGRAAAVVAARVTNRTGRGVALGAVGMIGSAGGDGGSWQLSGAMRPPAAVGYPYAAPPCRPAAAEASAETQRNYAGGGVLVLSPAGSTAGLAVGCLSSREGAPTVSARFEAGKGGTSLSAGYNLGGRILAPGESIDLDPAWLSAEEDRFAALERYGDAVAALSPLAVRKGSNALWCSWYPIRMTLSEEIALANAEIAARHFKPLGLDLIQLDHGWQRGDICGDWYPNERFPHGLKWLAGQLRSRYGMKLGLWIAPTQVAATSQLYKDHPEYLRLDPAGKPRAFGRWFWAPHPEMYRVDASRPGAEKWIEETFARLAAEGAVYFKIDFIAGSAPLDRAMAAIRRGAGPDAWIRYCQTPPLLSVGLADSAYIGDDTGDAGLPNWIELERINAGLLAASYWVNDRLYHREICDMSVGLKAGVEEARFRMSLMTLGGCSISFSDDFRDLPPERIRMMQQCLPPGNPAARPLDLFDRELPSLWHMHCKNEAGEWDAVGLFNFEDQPQDRTVEFSALGLPEDAELLAFEFWEGKYLGPQRGRATLTLAPRTARILLLHRRPDRPKPIATDMHLLGGFHEIKRLAWDEGRLALSGRYRRAAGLEGKAFIYVPDGYRLSPASQSANGPVRLIPAGKNLVVQEVRFEEAEADWAIQFESTPVDK